MAYTEIYQGIADSLGISLTAALVLMTILAVWTLVWKGFALWKASKKNQPVWFVILLIVNTVGILEILYLFMFSKLKINEDKKREVKSKKTKKRR
jgi:hypothetical protein